ncbi:MAG: hypothetical protein NZO16_00985 [Deltaproteobacteria bacterium]|nr:hypothetical protein [Deltaproteobacteria bacterium]
MILRCLSSEQEQSKAVSENNFMRGVTLIWFSLGSLIIIMVGLIISDVIWVFVQRIVNESFFQKAVRISISSRPELAISTSNQEIFDQASSLFGRIRQISDHQMNRADFPISLSSLDGAVTFLVGNEAETSELRGVMSCDSCQPVDLDNILIHEAKFLVGLVYNLSNFSITRDFARLCLANEIGITNCVTCSRLTNPRAGDLALVCELPIRYFVLDTLAGIFGSDTLPANFVFRTESFFERNEN